MTNAIEFDPDLTITDPRTINSSGYVAIGREHSGKTVRLVIVDLQRPDTDETSNVINSNIRVQQNGSIYIGEPYAGRTTEQIKVLFSE